MKKAKINPEADEILLLKAQLVRALADYDNLRKRTEEEKSLWVRFATQKFIQNLLPVLDTFEAAQNHLKDSGLAIGISQLKDLLQSEGLEEIRPKEGEKFNEHLHEAIDVVENKGKAGLIAEVLVPGWKFVEGAVVRHAKVKVYKA